MYQPIAPRSFAKPLLKVFIVVVLCSLLPRCNSVPSKVLGIFNQENCVSTIAASLAVKLFNANKDRSLNFTYENIHEDVISKLTDSEALEELNNSIVITGEPFLCERLAKLLFDMANYLVCYGTPTEKTFELIQNKPNVYLSQPNPEALVHCLFKLIKLIIGQQEDTSTGSFIINDGHPYHVVLEKLLPTLHGMYAQYKDMFQVRSLSDDDQAILLTTEGIASLNASLINAITHEHGARNLLCHFFHNTYSQENRTLILVGLPNTNWLNSEDGRAMNLCDDSKDTGKVDKQVSCSLQAMRNAAEGHLLLEYPATSWTNSDNERWDISVIKSDLKQRLQACRIVESEEVALLVFDSVWAILKAINKAFKGNTQVRGESVGQALIDEPFTGLTGETISFNKYRNGTGGCTRSTVNAAVNIFRFENGAYIPIGRHFNTNNSFSWFHPLISGSPHSWKPLRPNCPNSTKFWSSDGTGWILQIIGFTLLGLLLVAIVSYSVFYCFRQRCERRKMILNTDAGYTTVKPCSI